MKKQSLNPNEDHSPRYNISKEKLDKANKKILETSKAKRDNVKEKDGILYHKRLHPKKIWDKFLDTEEEDYKAHMHYGKEEILNIGWMKFIEAMDWRNESDVKKWRTDKLHIVICSHCKNEFAIFEHFAICKACEKIYDMDILTEFLKDRGAMAYPTLISFIYNKGVRENFLKKNIKKLKKETMFEILKRNSHKDEINADIKD